MEQLDTYILYMYILQWVYVLYTAMDAFGMGGQR